MVSGRHGPSRRICRVLPALAVVLAMAHPGAAASLTARDVQLLGQALAFLQPPPTGGNIAVVFAHDDAASRQDAEAILALLGDGLRSGGALLRPMLRDSTSLGAGGFTVLIAAEGANGEALLAASRANHALCVTGDLAAVQAGLCTMAIRSQPRVEAMISHAAAATAGIEFIAAFRLMVREF
jgi:hypothetical protein